MRRVFVVLGMMTIVALSAGLLSAQECLCQQEPAVVGDCGCNDCTAAPRCSHCEKYKAYRASFGCFNCACQGSYKYPVPPQSTYFWPGMYSQQAMTAYVSPYRFPPLNLPADMLPPPAAPAVKTPPRLSRVHQASFLQMPEMPVIDSYDHKRSLPAR